VVLDGAVVGVVANGRVTALPVGHGTHTMRVGHRWLASPLGTSSVEDEDTVRFVCRPGHTRWSGLPTMSLRCTDMICSSSWSLRRVEPARWRQPHE
jgi:hypothetical protein